MKPKERFASVGLALIILLVLLNIAGWIESMERRDMYRHCVFQHLDEVTTDQQISELHRACAALNDYEGPLDEE